MQPNRTFLAIFFAITMLLASTFAWYRFSSGRFSRRLDVPVMAKVSEEKNGFSQGVVISVDPHANYNSLSPAEFAAGFQMLKNPENGGKMFVHPNSPCWLELPGPELEAGPDAGGTPPAASSSSSGFLGPLACMPCHRQNYLDFAETAHYQSSQPASSSTIDGSFSDGENQLATNHPDLHFEMTHDDRGFYQDVYFRDLKRRVRFDIVTGSGKSAQTYLHWAGERLFQMHVSYFKPLSSWINSPGFHDGTAWYTRETIPKCVQCHMTYMEWIPGTINSFRRERTIFGVTCERCHGPGQEHVEFHQRNPTVTTSHYIANPSKLTAEQSNDICAQCHLGTATPLREPFSFRPGDKSSDFFEVHPEEDSQQGIVHTANQLERMKKSVCYLDSASMTCASCHNPHRNERGDLKLFSNRCLQCHESEHCGMSDELGAGLSNNCIDCHMAMGFDDHIQLETPDTIHMPLLRDHFIRILPDATRRFLQNR